MNTQAAKASVQTGRPQQSPNSATTRPDRTPGSMTSGWAACRRNTITHLPGPKHVDPQVARPSLPALPPGPRVLAVVGGQGGELPAAGVGGAGPGTLPESSAAPG